MATIREDVVKVTFDTNSKKLTELQKEVNDLKKKLTGGVGNNAFDGLKKSASGAVSPLNKVKEAAAATGKKVSEIGTKAANTAFKGLTKLAGISFKALTAGITATATATGALVKNAVSAYADYEQLVGGVDTLFKDSSSTVQKYANDAFKTAGLSANKYMDTITSFSASMISSVGGDTAKAAELSNMAITDMADNANKMGTSMDSIIETYQSLARGNYAMLDNLKLGFGGTKEELERLIKTAAEFDSSVDANSMSYANIVKAIHAVQESMDITGTTAKEAEKTISGSLSSMKSAWQNLMPALIQGGDSFDRCIDNLISSVATFAENVKPAILKALSGVGSLIEKLAPIIESEFPKLVDELLPPLLKAATALLKGLIKSLPSMIGAVAKELPNILKQVGESIAEVFGEKFTILNKIGDFFSQNSKKIADFIPVLLGLVGAFMAFKKVSQIKSVFSGLFGKGTGESSGGLFSGLSSLAKIKTGTVLKGIANISLILVSLGALVLLANKVFAGGVDFIGLLKVTTLIGVLGLVGAGLAKLAGIVGAIPMGVVIKGLANIAIVLTGVGALLLVATKVFSGGVDFQQMFSLISLIGLLGAVGSALAAFAGLVGLIPFPLVLSGLANITLVLAGITALIVAFGALSKIQGFNAFIAKGGETLANLFNQIGKIAGSLVGGLGEGITNSLPKIGENLAAFVTALKPVFTMFNGVDMSGVGNFFSEFGSFMLKMAGNKLASFFTGGTNLAEIGAELSAFASSASGFFNAVAAIPENGFINASKLFECLAGLGNLPNSGGIAQWFAGDIDYSKIASGLEQLASSGIVSFFQMAESLSPAAFSNATALFESLAGIGNLPNSGGAWGWLAGDVSLKALADDLVYFAQKTTVFFNAVDGLNLGNLNGLWDSLSRASEVTTNLSSTIDTSITTIIEKIKQLPVQMVTAITTGGAQMIAAMQNILSQLVAAVSSVDLYSSGVNMMNGLVLGIQSQGSAAVSAAVSIANQINSAFDSIQKISSPSKVWKKKGSFLIQGAVRGMESEIPSLKTTTQRVANVSSPYNLGDYTPEYDGYYSSNTSREEYNSYSPTFNVTVNGSLTDRNTVRQTKQQIFEMMNEYFENLARQNKTIRQV